MARGRREVPSMNGQTVYAVSTPDGQPREVDRGPRHERTL